MIHHIRVAIGIDHGHHRDAQLSRLLDRDLFLIGVDDKNGVGKLLHTLDSPQGLLELFFFPSETQHLFLRQGLDDLRVVLHFLKPPQSLDALADGRKVRKGPAQPAVVDMEHPAPLRLFPNRILGLLFCAHEEDIPAAGGQVANEPGDPLEHRDGLLQVDDVDAVASPENIGLHLGVPATGLVAKVNPGLQ